jgi:hypothetical protein
MKDVEGVSEVQIVQDGFDHLTVKIVQQGSRNQDVQTLLRSRLNAVCAGSMKLDFEWTDRIDRTPAGKFRFQMNLMAGRNGNNSNEEN